MTESTKRILCGCKTIFYDYREYELHLKYDERHKRKCITCGKPLSFVEVTLHDSYCVRCAWH